MKCRFEHDGDCCNSGATQYMCKCKQSCDTIIPVTNADRIRAMSDEELASALCRECVERESCYGCFAYRDDGNCPGVSEEAWKQWLQQPAEGD